MPYNFPNEPAILPRLAAGIDDNDTSLTVDSWGYHGADTPGNFVVRIDNEYIHVGTRTGFVLSGLTRAAEEPGDPASHLAGSIVRVALTRDAILDIASSVSPVILLYDNKLAASAASIDTGVLPTTYKALHILFTSRTTQAATTTGSRIRFSGDAGANYDGQQVFAFGTVEDGNSFLNATGFLFSTNGASAPANTPGVLDITIPDYTSTTFFKTIVGQYGTKAGSGGSDMGSIAVVWWWKNLSAINQIVVLPDSGLFAAGSRLTVYGLN